MTREDIIRMAREAGFEELFKDSHDWVCFTEDIERFFQAAYAAGAAAEREKWMERTAILIRGEREACAKVCEELHPGLATRRAAEIIRARGNT